ncbi:MAG: hypothetical protein IKL70_01925 [Oscillospiraceae bacterium]|nr:hypothetical protein [Oscillospiraceae bacterium]
MISWDVNDIEGMKSDIRKKRNEMENIRDTIVNERSSLSSAWRGDSGEVADMRLEADIRMLNALSDEMTKHIAILDYAIEQYTNCENSVLNKVRNGVS